MNTKKVLSFVMLGLLLFSFAMPLVIAEETVKLGELDVSVPGSVAADGALGEPLTGSSAPLFVLNAIEFFNLGTTWGDVIVSLVLIAVIFAAAWDILAFTAFETEWVKYTIAGGIALVVIATGVINTFSRWVIALAGGSVAFATLGAICVGIFFFILGTVAKGRMKLFKAKGEAMEAKAGYVRAGNAIGGLKDIDKAAARDKR